MNIIHIAKVPIFIIPVFAFFLAQMIKVAINYIMYKRFKAERVWGAGGMPSSHSAGVCSLIMIVGRMQGISSVMFAVAVVFAMITMYDAAGVRRATGRNAKVINIMRKHTGLENNTGENAAVAKDTADTGKTEHKTLYRVSNDLHSDGPLKESLGHTPLQVAAGAILGLLIGILVPDGWLM